MHALLGHLERVGFAGAPRALGLDERGREVLSFLPGNTVGNARPWPSWVHSDDALIQVADWARSYHAAVANFEPAADASWREGGQWRPGLLVGHNDAAPYNAAWDDQGRLLGFFDWDFAAPVSLDWDLAFIAFAWVPLHAREVVASEGFTFFDERPRRLRLFLERYGWEGDTAAFVRTVQTRVLHSTKTVETTAAQGDSAYQQMLRGGVATSLRTAVAELTADMEYLTGPVR